MEKIHENMCFDVVFLYENIRTCLFTYVFLYFLHLVLTFTPHYIIMVKGLLPCLPRPNFYFVALGNNRNFSPWLQDKIWVLEACT